MRSIFQIIPLLFLFIAVSCGNSNKESPDQYIPENEEESTQVKRESDSA